MELDLVILANIQAFTAIEATGKKKKTKSILQLSLPRSAHLQGDVSQPLWYQQISVSEAYRPLSQSWYFPANTRQQQETTT